MIGLSRVIDFHAHAFPEAIAEKAVAQIGRHYSLNMNCKGILEDLRQSAESRQVDYVVFHSTATKPAQVRTVNDWLAEHDGGMLVGFGTLHPDYEDIEGELDRIISLGLKGIKLHPEFQGFYADESKMDRVYKAIGSKLPVLIHAGDENFDNSSPRRIARVLERFPELTLVAAHLGGHKQWEESRKYLVGRNLYFDTSSALWFMEPQEAVTLMRDHGTHRIVFGTDYPIVNHQMELEVFDQLPLTAREREDILYNNAARLLKLPS